jgi:hypothetical protein
MLVEYRIKVEELNDGTVGYIPQVTHVRVYIGTKYYYPYIEWQNLYLPTDDLVCKSASKQQSFHTEDVARLIIDRYKQQLESKDAKKVKSIKFINL